MCMLDAIHAKRDEIHSIARKHKAEKLWVFGSVARKEERPDSDIDLLSRITVDLRIRLFGICRIRVIIPSIRMPSRMVW